MRQPTDDVLRWTLRGAIAAIIAYMLTGSVVLAIGAVLVFGIVANAVLQTPIQR